MQTPSAPEPSPYQPTEGAPPSSYGAQSSYGPGPTDAYPQQTPYPQGAAEQSGYPQPGYQQSVPAGGQSTSVGFFKALFDLSFYNFITLSFAKFIYILVIGFTALTWLFLIVSAFNEDAMLGFVILLLGWLPGLMMIVLARLSLESAVALIRVAQNTSEMLKKP